MAGKAAARTFLGDCMPLFDWLCEDCTTVTEVIRPSKDYLIPPDEGCQKCASKNLQKIIIRPKNCAGVLLLGDSGWQHTDYSSIGKHVRSSS